MRGLFVMISASSTNNRRAFGAVALLYALIGIGFTAFSPGLGGSFLLDDFANIPQTALRTLDLDEIQSKTLWGTMLGSLSRSLTNLTFGLTQYFSGYDPHVFKYQNLLIHLINALLVFWLVSILLRTGRSYTNSSATKIAFAVASIWLLHPLQVSTVLYAVQRLVLLSALFTLAALITYIKGRLLLNSRPIIGSVLALGGTTTFGALAFLSKENAALLPIYIAIVELIFFKGAANVDAQRRSIYILLFVLVALPLSAGVIYGLFQFHHFTAGYAGREYTLSERLLTQAHVIVLYLRLFFFPIPSGMSLFHDNFPIQRTADLATISLVLSYAGLLLMAVVLRKRYPLIGFGVLWFFASHLLESTYLPLELVFEHRNYLAILGLSAIFVQIILIVLRSDNLRRLQIPTIGAFVVLLALNTAARSYVWGNTELMYRTEYLVRPDSPRVLAGMLYYESQRGDDEALNRHLRELKALDEFTAATDLLHIALLCNSKQAPLSLRNQAKDLLSNGIITAYTVNTLMLLVDHFANERCPAIAPSDLLSLTNAAYINEKTTNSDFRCTIGHLHTQMLSYAGLWEDAANTLGNSLDQCALLSPSKFRLVIDNLLYEAKRRGYMDQMVAVINEAVESHEDLVLAIYGGHKVTVRKAIDAGS